MNIDHPYAEAGRSLACLGDGMGNVVEFEVEKNAIALADQLLHPGRAGGGKQLLAYLEFAQAGVEAFHQLRCGCCAGIIQCDNDLWVGS